MCRVLSARLTDCVSSLGLIKGALSPNYLNPPLQIQSHTTTFSVAHASIITAHQRSMQTGEAKVSNELLQKPLTVRK